MGGTKLGDIFPNAAVKTTEGKIKILSDIWSPRTRPRTHVLHRVSLKDKINLNSGDFNLHDFIGDSYCILFSHPADYTPVCTTELGNAAKYAPQFKEVNTLRVG